MCSATMQNSINWATISFDWNHVRAFLVAAEEGSLSAGARELGLTQPTLSRQISALEASLNVLLLERGTRGLILTESGKELLEHVRTMGQAAAKISLSASGQSDSIEGQVCITATNAFASLHLPPMLKRLRAQAPQIQIEIVTSNELQDITARNADIAIRHTRPTQPDLIGKHVGDMSAQLYASTDFLQRYGRPTCAQDCSTLDFIGFEKADTLIPVLGSLGLSLTENSFCIITSSGTTILELVRQGLGVGLLTSDVEDMFPELERVLPELEPMSVPIWLVTHRELRTSKRIRVVFDLLAEEIRRKMG